MRAALFLLLCVPLPAVQQDYRALVDAYRRNGTPQIEQLLRIPIEQARGHVADAVHSASPWSWEEQRAAAILHTEAAVRLIASKNLQVADEHLQLAQRLLARVADRVPAQDDFAWRWHQVVSPLITELGARGLAARLNAYASARWGRSNARQAFLRGVEAEWRGNVHGRVLTPGQSGTFIGPDDRREHWFSTAADAFAEALRGDPNLKAAPAGS